MPSVARKNPFTKIAVAIVGLGVLAYLFYSTLSNVGSQPYTVPAAALEGWTVELDVPSGPDGPLLSLRPPPELGMSLFDQVFQRTMESYATPANPGITLVSQREHQQALAPNVSPSQLAELAEREGLAAEPLVPQCMAVHRTSGGREQRLFFVLFDLPGFGRFREAVGQLAAESQQFDPTALAPALLIAASDPRLLRQPASPGQVDLTCEAPVRATEYD